MKIMLHLKLINQPLFSIVTLYIKVLNFVFLMAIHLKVIRYTK